MSQNRFNTSNIFALATLNVVLNPNLVAQHQKAQKEIKAHETQVKEQNKLVHKHFLKQQPKHENRKQQVAVPSASSFKRGR